MTNTRHLLNFIDLEPFRLRFEVKSSWDLYSELYPQLSDSQRRVVFVRGWKMTTKESLLAECAAALQFPPIKAENWDAFEEDLLSLEWIPENHKLLVVLESEKVLGKAPSERDTFFRILLAAVQQPRHNAILENAKLEVILQCDEQYLSDLHQLVRLAAAGSKGR